MHGRQVGTAVTLVSSLCILIACTQSSQTTSSNAPGRMTLPSSSIASSTSTATPAPVAPAYTSVPVRGVGGSATFDVRLPQVTGGDAAVRNRFNSGMRAGLHELIVDVSDHPFTISNGSLVTDERSRVTTISDTVIAGMGIYLTNAPGAAHPNNNIATTNLAPVEWRCGVCSGLWVEGVSGEARSLAGHTSPAAHERTGSGWA